MESNAMSSAVPLILSGPACKSITSIPSIPGSPLLFKPSLLLSSHTKSPMLNKGIKPKSTLRFVLLSVSSSLVGSASMLRLMVSLIIISLDPLIICVPSSSLLVLASVIAPGSKVAVPLPSNPVPIELTIFAGVPLLIFI